MADTFSKSMRSYVMSRVKSKNNALEMLVRKGLHRRGFRYTLHNRSLLGRPDMTFPKYSAVIFIHGCFWHGHSCPRSRLPKTRRAYWKNKIMKNQHRDQRARTSLAADGWRVLVVWECALRGKESREPEHVFAEISAWLRSNATGAEIKGE